MLSVKRVNMSKIIMKNCSLFEESKVEDFAILKNEAAPLHPVLLPALLLLFKDLRNPVEDPPLPALRSWRNPS